MKIGKASQLAKILLDRSAEYGDRLDAASDLEEYDDAVAEDALAIVGRDEEEDPGLLESCGDSLAGIWLRKGGVDYVILQGLTRPAYSLARRRLDIEKRE